MTNRTDTFDRANGAIGTPSDGGSAWSIESGTWVVASNLAQESGNGAQRICSLESSITDCDIQVTLSTVGSGTGLCARVVDNNNYFLLAVTSSVIAIYTVIGGAFSLVNQTTGLTIANGDAIKFTLSGTSQTAYQNGTLRVSGTSSSLPSGTRHGLRTNSSSTSRFNDFSITAPGSLTRGLFLPPHLAGLGAGGSFFGDRLAA